VYQGKWSILERDFEREIIPMAKAEGMALAPWGALGGGKFKTEEERKSGEGRNLAFLEKINPINYTAINKLVPVLEKLAKAKGTTKTGIALSYVMQKVNFSDCSIADMNDRYRTCFQLLEEEKWSISRATSKHLKK
jgi:aryl-alcohol dehydrogenase-like predicted oxidoreductase